MGAVRVTPLLALIGKNIGGQAQLTRSNSVHNLIEAGTPL